MSEKINANIPIFFRSRKSFTQILFRHKNCKNTRESDEKIYNCKNNLKINF